MEFKRALFRKLKTYINGNVWREMLPIENQFQKFCKIVGQSE